ncbi:MAG: flagellar export protein FliJ [Candidatus Hydrogenedentota bacterium]
MVFKFRFERILGLRKHKEKEKMEELAKEQKKLFLLYNELKRNLEESETKLKELREKEKGMVIIEELIRYRAYLTKLYKEEAALRKKIKKQEEVVEEKRLELVEASKERRMMERLKENQEKEYWIEFWKQDEKVNDDLTTARTIAMSGEKNG